MTDMKYDYKEEDAVHIKHFFFGFPLGGVDGGGSVNDGSVTTGAVQVD